MNSMICAWLADMSVVTTCYSQYDMNSYSQDSVNSHQSPLTHLMDCNQTWYAEKSARRKWKNLKDYYRREVRKLESPRSGDGANGIVTSSWPYFTQLSFLYDIYCGASRSSNVTQNETTTLGDDNQSAVDEDNESSMSYASHVSHSFTSSVSTSNSPFLSLHGASTSGATTSGQSKPATKRLRPEPDVIAKENEQLLEIERQKLKFLQKEQEESENDDLQFFRSLIPHMKSLTPIRKLRVRSQLQNLVLKELEELEQNSYPSSQSHSDTHPTPPHS
ncbi:hypothetical protein SK128_000127 [Halocaridina rubra]|uniref:BESS domain-containing protein n=1 Tax=Halocaridina rubra TaxID=373956 RepID=A0AAN8XWJ0_HALRR